MHLFRQAQTHICTVKEEFDKRTYFPPLGRNASCWAKFVRKMRRSFLIWSYNPRSIELYRTDHEMFNKRMEHVHFHINIIHPFSRFRTIYEIWMSFVLFLVIILTPFTVAFVSPLHKSPVYKARHEPPGYYVDLMETVLYVFCLIDMIITFFTGYQSKDTKEVILDPKKIAKNYLLGPYFITDFIALVPLYAIGMPEPYESVFELVRLIKIVRCVTFIQYIDRTAELLRISNLMFKAFQYVAVLFVILHWYACVYFLIPQIELIFGGVMDINSWTMDENIAMDTISYQYLYAFVESSSAFFCITQLQDGSTPPLTHWDPWEEVTAKILIFTSGKLIACIFTVLLLNIFLVMNNLETKYYEVIGEVYSYMKRRKLPIAMQQRLIHNYNYKYEMRFFKEAVITEILSDQLRKEIKLHVCKNLVENVKLLSDLPSKVLEDILIQLGEEIFLPNDIIMKANTMGDCMYFLASGTVAVSTPSGKELRHLHDGAYFGEVCLVVKHKKRTATVVAIEICELYRLDKKAFKKCLQRYPQLFTQLEIVAHMRINEVEEREADVERMEKMK